MYMYICICACVYIYIYTHTHLSLSLYIHIYRLTGLDVIFSDADNVFKREYTYTILHTI